MENGRKTNTRRTAVNSSRKSKKADAQNRRTRTAVPRRSVRSTFVPAGTFLSKAEKRMLDAHMALGATARKGNIPILRDVFDKGTQNPVIRLKCALQAVSSSVGGVIALSFPISLNQVYRYTSWDDVFDEFRIVRAEYVYHPHSVYYPTGTSRTITTYIDYDDAGAPVSKDSSYAFDTGKAWSTDEIIRPGLVLPDFVPDEQWYNCQVDQATAVAWVKFYSDGCSVSLPYGEAFGWMDVQFRQTG